MLEGVVASHLILLPYCGSLSPLCPPLHWIIHSLPHRWQHRYVSTTPALIAFLAFYWLTPLWWSYIISSSLPCIRLIFKIIYLFSYKTIFHNFNLSLLNISENISRFIPPNIDLSLNRKIGLLLYGSLLYQ